MRIRATDTEGFKTSVNKKTADWILYDDECGACRFWIDRWRGILEKRGFGIAPLQAIWVKEDLFPDVNDLTSDFRISLADGTHLFGPDAYRYAMKRIWWMRPVYLVSIIPLCRPIFNTCYRIFARHRQKFSRYCNLTNTV